MKSVNRLFTLILLLCTACATPTGAPNAIYGDAGQTPLAPAYALQDAMATGTAAARAIEGTATAQSDAVATEARASIALAEAQTQAAIPGMQTATAAANAINVATATEGAAYNATRIAATLAADTAAASRADFEANARLVMLFLAFAPIVYFLCRTIISVGKAEVSKRNMAAIIIIKGESGSPIAFLMPGNTGPQYRSLTGGYPTPNKPESTLEQQCREAWRNTTKGVFRDAAEAGSFSVNNISTRGGGQWSEDTVTHAQKIGSEIGAIVDKGGRTGWDWAEGWGLVELETEIDAGVWFTLPHRAPTRQGEEGALIWPTPPGQSEANRSKAKQPKQAKQGAEVGAI